MTHATPLTQPTPDSSPTTSPSRPPPERSYVGIFVALFVAYILLATGLYYFRGFRFITPDRWAPFLFLAALALGRGRVFVRDWIPFVLLLFGYEYMRGVASQVADLGTLTAADHGQIKIDFLLNSERWLFRGTIPSIWLQDRLFVNGDTRWYDLVAGLVYLLHFVIPLVFAFVLWLRNKEHYWRFTITLVVMSYIAFLFFLLLPAAPPWMANDWGYIEGLERPTSQAFRAVLPNRADNFDTFQIWTKASPNPVAPFPSLHAAFPWLVMMFAVKFIGRAGWILLLYNIAVWFSIIYLGLHWAVDILAGIALAVGIFFAMERLWPRLATFQGIPWPTPVAAAAANTSSVITVGTSSIHRRVMQYTLSREIPGLAAVAAVAATTFLILLQRGGIVGIDSAVQFYPFFSFLGENLRTGQLPVWNPHSYGGMPFIADPQSGWLYLPAMGAFTVLQGIRAIQAFMAFHLLLVAVGMYALARLLGLSMMPAVVAALTLQLSGWFSVRSACCTVELEVMSWLPLALVGVELAVRSTSWLGRVASWSVTSVALSQILAAWLGQGAYYVSLMIGGYIAYRTLIDPPGSSMTVGRRLRALTVHGSAVVLLTIGLSAAALLPRLEYLSASNLAAGYPWDGVHGGWPSLLRVAERLMGRTSYFAGTATLALASIGVVLGRRRFATPFFAFAAAFAVVLSVQQRTIVHQLLAFVLPRFEDVNRNLPERSMIVFYPAVALLAAVAIELLSVRPPRGARWLVLLSPVGLLAWTAVYLDDRASRVGQWTLIPILAVGAILLAAFALRLPALRRAAPLLLVCVVLADLLTSSHVLIQERTVSSGLARVNLDTYYDRPPAAAFLQSVPGPEPFRYFGYDPGIRGGTNNALYRRQFGDARTAHLLVNNRGAIYGLDDLQGANDPVHVARFDSLITAINGFPQDYHDAHIYPSGVHSPLLDLLNVHYIVVPSNVPPGRPDLLHLSQQLPTVYADQQVRVIRNTDALPRAWLVHQAVEVSPGQALPLMTSGRIDLRETAVLESAPPALATPRDPTADDVVVRSYAADEIVLTTRTTAPGLMVLSEIYAPGWNAYLDGQRVPLVVADHALRAVAVPAGEHTVTLRYESRALQAGLLVTGFTTLAVLGVAVALASRSLRRRRLG